MTTTLLAVDDSKTMRKVIEITFSGDDFRLLLCGSADEALGKLGERPSVALVDAGLGGYELCRRLKAAQPGLGVVILSNKQQPYDRALGGQVGADDFADKPFDTQQLIDKVNTLAKKLAGQPAAAPAPAAVAAQPAPVAAQPAPARSPAATTLAYGTTTAAAPVPVTAPPPVAPRTSTSPGIQASPAAFPSRIPAPPTVLGAQASADAARAAAAAPAPLTSAVATGHADFAQKLGGLGLTAAQVEGVLALSREVVERVVWEVVPTLAETMIREEIQRLTKE